MRLLRELLLLEIPLGDFEPKYMSDPGSFPDQDRKLLGRKDYVKHVSKRFAKTPYLFDLYFVNLPEEKYQTTQPSRNPADRGSGKKFFSAEFDEYDKEFSGKNISPAMVKQITGLNIRPKSNSITVVYLSNADISDVSMPMTPWIMAHRFAHSLAATQNENPTDAAIRLIRIIEELEVIADARFLQLFIMRSARKGLSAVDNANEMAVEVVAQYIMTGRITLNINAIKSKEEELRSYEKELNEIVKELLDDAVGGIWMSA